MLESNPVIVWESGPTGNSHGLLQGSTKIGKPATTVTTEYREVMILNENDVSTSKLLGSGAFCSVYEVKIGGDSTPFISQEEKEEPIAALDSRHHGHRPVLTRMFSTDSQLGGDQPLQDMIRHIDSLNSSPATSVSTSSSCRTPTRRIRYALKKIRPELVQQGQERGEDGNMEKLQMAIQDMVMETNLLIRVPCHENIIRLYGMSRGFVEDDDDQTNNDNREKRGGDVSVPPPLPMMKDCFIIVERLEETLHARLQRWVLRRKQQLLFQKQHSSSSLSSFVGSRFFSSSFKTLPLSGTKKPLSLKHLLRWRPNNRKQRQQQEERQQLPEENDDNDDDEYDKDHMLSLQYDERYRIETVALGIARALQHLHRHQIIYRDLKPANVGFAINGGGVRLFDFGLARVVDKKRYGDRNATNNDKDSKDRRLTGAAGTVRYMSPEVALHQDYGLSADVYSFSMLLWQICTLERPFQRCQDHQEWFHMAITQRQRPSVRRIASPALRELLSAGWDPDPNARPTFALVVRQLERELYGNQLP